MNTLRNIIPVPFEVTPEAGTLPVTALNGYCLDADSRHLSDELARLAAVCDLPWKATPDGNLRLVAEAGLATEEWEMAVAPSGIRIAAGGRLGARYALDALEQMLLTAMRDGPRQARLDCGRIHDRPRFAWRGMLLDSARHFQRPAMVKAVLRLLARWRMNTFHWHLIDSQGFRVPSTALSRMTAAGTMTDGQYTRGEIADILECARDLGITVVPEFDMPGHSRAFLKAYPECACNPQHPGNEVCLGNPKTKALLQEFLDEMMALFPDSPYLHLGGDEADTGRNRRSCSRDCWQTS